jgi:predicted lipid-binding transport protein (Tim44 family)
VPVALLAAVCAVAIRAIARSHPVWGYALAVGGGVLLGLAWTYLVALLLGGWFFAISVFPVPVWIAAAIAGLAAGVLERSRPGGILLPVGSAVLSAAVVSAALIGIQQARQHPGFVAIYGAAVTAEATDAEIATVRQALEASPYIDEVVLQGG